MYIKSKININLLSIFLIFFLCNYSALGQLPSDLSKLKASQISDSQLIEFYQKAKASGQGEQEILLMFRQRGLPEDEIQTLSERLLSLNKVSSIEPASTVFSDSNTPRKLKLERTETANVGLDRSQSRVFGAELFSDASPFLIQNLNIATPANYKVGPTDELIIEVFGNNVFSQRLQVSREGFINVRYVGLLNVSGYTIEDVTSIVKNRLSSYIPALSTGATKIQISLGKIRSITVSVVGAVKKPGSLTIPSLTTLFNALYLTGGPLENGSMRKIELIRGNKKIVEADLYDFLTKGDQTANVFLQDNDLIRVPFAESLVQLTGHINRGGIYELLVKDKLSNLLEYAGGFEPDAYKARITGTRNGILKREIIDVAIDQFNQFVLNHGDSLHVGNIVDLFSNRVSVAGAVYKPGVYTWTKGQKLSDLIQKAAGLKDDAFLGQINILRTYDNLDKENLSVDYRAILSGKSDFELIKEDFVTVFSSYELKDSFYIKVSGEVKKPGLYRFADSLTIQQLILLAGGLTDKSVSSSIEISRLNKSFNPQILGSPRTEVIKLDRSSGLSRLDNDFKLLPYDEVFIRTDPSKRMLKKVSLVGEILYPGEYFLLNGEERLSSLLSRAGGFLPEANKAGVKIFRQTQAESVTKATKYLKQKLNDSTSSSEIYSLEGYKEIAVDPIKSLNDVDQSTDLILESGDEILVTSQKNTITILGNVLRPVSVPFSSRKVFKNYISSAGGFSNRARPGKSFVIYSNGRASKTKRIFGIFIKYPKIKTGSTIVVPAKREKDNKFDTAKASILVSGLAAIATTIAVLRGL
jgi:protein involved in polysaccharide export with SLBB domain